MTTKNKIGILFLSILFLSCSQKEYTVFQGQYDNETASQIEGFPELLPSLLEKNNMTNDEFIHLSTSITTGLPADECTKLKQFRETVPFPTQATLLQKVIPISDITTYMENTYGGTVGGFVATVGDTKNMITLQEVYWGLRLDYAGTKFKPDGAGYAVIRFYSNDLNNLVIPYGPALGGNVTDTPPFGGGGFTTSKLGYGGTPEYKFDSYYAPVEGAELYEATPQGKLILRSVYTGGKWQTYEGKTVKTKAETSNIIPLPLNTYVSYKGERLLARAKSPEGIHLFSFDERIARKLNMLPYEKGVYMLIADEKQVGWE